MSIPKVLVVDDNTKVLFAFQSLLHKEGVLSIDAATGKEALEKLSAEKPHAIFLDLSLPDVKGLYLLKKINKQYPGIAVIVVTSIETKEFITEAMKYGAVAHLEKPLSLKSIRKVLERIKSMNCHA
jgi:two-component system response regulator (stage 0 sporulation protein F)